MTLRRDPEMTKLTQLAIIASSIVVLAAGWLLLFPT